MSPLLLIAISWVALAAVLATGWITVTYLAHRRALRHPHTWRASR